MIKFSWGRNTNLLKTSFSFHCDFKSKYWNSLYFAVKKK